MPARGRIFISYRRADSLGIAGRIRDKLVTELGGERVDFDIDTIPLGVDFRVRLGEMVAECDHLLAIIGPRWLDAADGQGRRLDHDDDWVRIEIAAALGRDIPVIPVLVDGATMPAADQLPVPLRDVAYRNGTQVRNDPDFHPDMARLIAGVSQVPVSDEVASGIERSGPARRSMGDEISAILAFDRASRLDLREARAAAEGGRAPVLETGRQGAWVEYLQNRLAGAGADLRPGGADGQFGPATRGAVVALQRRAGLEPDGIVGPDTWGALAMYDPGVAPTVGPGSRGPWVRHLQSHLLRHGASLEPYGADSQFGSVTRDAVVTLQHRAGLEPDGIVGPATWPVVLGPETRRR